MRCNTGAGVQYLVSKLNSKPASLFLPQYNVSDFFLNWGEFQAVQVGTLKYASKPKILGCEGQVIVVIQAHLKQAIFF